MTGGPLFITRWTRQADRRRAGLDPARVPLDPRGFTELLAFAPRYGRLVRFFDADNRRDGDWQAFFRADGAMILAEIAGFDTDAAARRFHALAGRTRDERDRPAKLALFGALLQQVLALMRQVDGWIVAAEALHQPPPVLRRQLDAVVAAELGPQLKTLLGYIAGLEQAGLAEAWSEERPHRFHWTWRTDENVVVDVTIYEGRSRRQRIDAAIGALAGLFDRVIAALADLVATAGPALAACLDDPHHPPHIALYMAFAWLFGHAQARLNALPGRLIDFYYRDVLREHPRGALGDQVFLTFTAAPRPNRQTRAEIAAGTRFPAGTDAAGRPILFAATRGLDVTGATLMRITATGLQRGAGGRLREVRRTDITLTPEGWPLFATDTAEAHPVRLGFAVAAAALQLSGGTRRITLELRPTDDFRRRVLDPALARLGRATGLATEAAMSALLAGGFGVEVTTATGWLAVEARTTATTDATGWILAFGITLPPSAPAVTVLPASGLAQPALRIRLPADRVPVAGPVATARVALLSILEDMPLGSVRLRCAVTDLAGLRVATIAGPADATAPIAPFGAIARPGGWFEIGHPELFDRLPDRIGLTLPWVGLPSDPRGFAGYYRQYRLGPDRRPTYGLFTNRSFEIAVALRGASPWQLGPAEAQAQPLFHSEGAAAPLAPATTIDLHPVADPVPDPPDPATARLRITLTAPAYGFGDELYAPNLMNAVQPVPLAPAPPPPEHVVAGALAPLWWHVEDDEVSPAEAQPNPPWIPQIAGLSLDYDLATDIPLADALFHLLPDGSLVAATMPRLLSPMPAATAWIDLGFAGIERAGPLTLLLRVEAGADPAHEATGGVTWAQRSDSDWIDVSPVAADADTTFGLANSGILRFVLAPPAPTPDGLVWLRASATRDISGFPRLIGITPHALVASRVIAADTTSVAPVPAGTIKAATPPMPGVAAIVQPAASFGGRDAEAAETLPLRLGERLRHKDRATLGWDYERLVLERFPEIAKVRVLPARRGSHGRAPGEVMVVVVPGPGGSDARSAAMPRTSLDTRARIQANLSAQASPFARIHVVDPPYLPIAVSARVFFRDDVAGDPVDQLEQALHQALSPWSDLLTLADDCHEPELRAIIASFIETRPQVAGLAALSLHFDLPATGHDWFVPTTSARHDIVDAGATD